MDIKYLGHSSFFIKTKDLPGGRVGARLVTDPYDPSIGLKFPKTEADIVTVSHGHPDHSYIKGVGGAPLLVVDMPGEYEKNGLRVFGYQSYHDDKKGAERGENIMYKFEAEGISVLHCGDLGFMPDDSFIEEVGDVDILLVPTGGFYTINADQAIELAKKIEPAIIIPMHYNDPKLNQKITGSMSPVTEFLKKMGNEATAPVPKLSLKKEDLIDQMKVIVMQVSS